MGYLRCRKLGADQIGWRDTSKGEYALLKSGLIQDAGPAAVAFTPRHKADAPDGLEAKGERWVLAERIEDANARADRVLAILGEMEA